MNASPTIDVIIPAYNEEQSIHLVIKDIPAWVRTIYVVNNNSTDQTAEIAEKAGAFVLHQPKPGYGNACLKALEHISANPEKPEIIVFLDGDYSDYPEEMPRLLEPILNDNMQLVIGARKAELREPGSMTPQQLFGNWLATNLMKLFYQARFTDLGPFRAITYPALLKLGMQDKNYGWTIEMQLKALKHNLRYCEIPVSYRERIGVSKVSGTLKGSVKAGIKILGWIAKYGISK